METGLDAHKKVCRAAIVDEEGEVVTSSRSETLRRVLRVSCEAGGVQSEGFGCG